MGGWFSQVDCIEEKDPVGFPGVVGHIKTFLGTSDFKRIHDAGFNHVRLPVKKSLRSWTRRSRTSRMQIWT